MNTKSCWIYSPNILTIVITVLNLCQDMFLPGKRAEIIFSNAHYIKDFKSPRDHLGLRN